jgi:hypothetical protein
MGRRCCGSFTRHRRRVWWGVVGGFGRRVYQKTTVSHPSPTKSKKRSKTANQGQAFLAVITSKHPSLSSQGDPSRLLPLPDRTLEALISFLGCCRRVLSSAFGKGAVLLIS